VGLERNLERNFLRNWGFWTGIWFRNFLKERIGGALRKGEVLLNLLGAWRGLIKEFGEKRL